METRNLATYPLTIFADDFCWEGLLDIPAHRRVSDFVNDRDTPFLKLREARFMVWQGDAFDAPQQAPVAVLVKKNIVALVPARDMPQPANDPFDVVEKASRRFSIHIPPLLLRGEFHSSPLIEWVVALNIARTDFIPFTDVSIWQYHTRTLLHERLPLVLTQMQRIVALEPEETTGQGA